MKPITFLLSCFFLFTLIGCSPNIEEERQWSSYRGYYSSGVLDNTTLPSHWDVEGGTNIKWKTDIPGLALSCPVIWGDKLFITSAISQTDNTILRAGSYVNSNPVEDESVHDWVVYCFDNNTGDIIWEKTAFTGVPQVKRHPKSTHANCTPATDGEHIVAFFGSEGLYCYDMDGDLLWKKNFGRLHAGAWAEHRGAIEWEFGSSPLIHKGVVLIQSDVRGESFLGAFDVETGDELWKKSREEHPGWCTPNIYNYNGKDCVVVNGYKHRGAYDFETGEEIWTMSGGGDIPVPTPQIGDGLIYFNSAHGRFSPVMAVKADAKGDITLEKGETFNEFIQWSFPRGGSYMHSLLLYENHLYNVGWNGSVECLNPLTGDRIYKQTLGQGDSFIASPVASDGKIYVISDHGLVYTLKAGPEFEILAENDLGDICMVVPALSDNAIFFRTQHSLIAVAGE
ncbi:MAG: PQQ-binding-like beta-propeller repeat protein [Bacteroidetes bacterium]|jgi:outer membrane protein assembly factor BamB|nr:PQQ-binding-like beta-propeller repeat protein [Bacteroidota bacterium]MBT3750455.1 PQQ-binding-like beta-propeller repeat protein [Bacteroidota bacterium]MBT4397868.1 PQQ-binding-like beta-propeller repeat protein [Bacteroidota bacterium]MBT4411460.1 PQQ-binding-like beta-propeller repeat protein [Bacteroidota bacterium]MBT5425682.1 PQQ-binding-like beta-propeller repeat protein [Bacteroidota bacterium]